MTPVRSTTPTTLAAIGVLAIAVLCSPAKSQSGFRVEFRDPSKRNAMVYHNRDPKAFAKNYDANKEKLLKHVACLIRATLVDRLPLLQHTIESQALLVTLRDDRSTEEVVRNNRGFRQKRATRTFLSLGVGGGTEILSQDWGYTADWQREARAYKDSFSHYVLDRLFAFLSKDRLATLAEYFSIADSVFLFKGDAGRKDGICLPLGKLPNLQSWVRQWKKQGQRFSVEYPTLRKAPKKPRKNEMAEFHGWIPNAVLKHDKFVESSKDVGFANRYKGGVFAWFGRVIEIEDTGELTRHIHVYALPSAKAKSRRSRIRRPSQCTLDQ